MSRRYRYDRATGSSVDERLTELISTDGPLVVTEPVLMDVLAGAVTDARENDLRRAAQVVGIAMDEASLRA